MKHLIHDLLLLTLLCACVLQQKKEAWGIRCWKGKLDEEATAVRQTTKREWVCLSDTMRAAEENT